MSRADQERLEAARVALVGTGYFTSEQVGADIAPRITELWSSVRVDPDDPETIDKAAKALHAHVCARSDSTSEAEFGPDDYGRWWRESGEELREDYRGEVRAVLAAVTQEVKP